jgi:hypothetical protein
MLKERTISIASAYWARHLGCARDELFAEPMRLVTHGRELADYSGVFALFRNGATIASLPPDRTEKLQKLLSAVPRDGSPESFARALRSVATAVISPAFVGYAEAAPEPVHTARAPAPQTRMWSKNSGNHATRPSGSTVAVQSGIHAPQSSLADGSRPWRAMKCGAK